MARLLTLVVLALAAAGCGDSARHSEVLAVVDAYAAAPVTTEAGVVYLRVVNPLDVPDTLVRATSPIAGSAAVHVSTRTGGLVRMHAAGPLEIPAHGELQLKPGGLHLMLMMLSTRPEAGDTIDVTLHFRRAGAIAVRVPVIAYADVAERAAAAQVRP